MKRRGRKGSLSLGVSLMEITAAVFFFILCASQCILAFAVSEKISRHAAELSKAVAAAETAIEVWKAEGEEGLLETLCFSEGATWEKGKKVYWAGLDGQGRLCGLDVYTCREPALPDTVKFEIYEDTDRLSGAVVTVSRNSDIFYEGEEQKLLLVRKENTIFVLEAKNCGKKEKQGEPQA